MSLRSTSWSRGCHHGVGTWDPLGNTTLTLFSPPFLPNDTGQVSTALAITRNLGTDATEEYVAIHSRTAWKQLHDFQIGVLRRPSRSDETETSTSASTTETETEMTGDANPRVNVKAPPGSHPVPTQDTHPMPSWLSADRDFWKRYSGGVTAQVLAYLGAQGYPQDQAGDVEDDDLAGGAAVAEDDGARPRDRVKRWGRKVATAVAVFAAGTLLVVR